jgi:hypothetical protein
MIKKVLICGFPHCGTTILKSIISHIENVYEIIDEVYDFEIFNKINYDNLKDINFIVGKCPWTFETFFNEYSDYIKICIIRNPLFVFSSLNNRFDYNLPDNHSINLYIEYCKTLLHLQTNNQNNTFIIKYEELFENNFEKINEILIKIGFKFTNKIYSNELFFNKTHNFSNNDELIKFKNVDNLNHHEYRFIQINQQFINNNDVNKINLLESQLLTIKNNEYIKLLYNDI